MMNEDEEDEMLFREMNPEDEFFMGDKPSNEYIDEPNKEANMTNNRGCAGLFSLLLSLIVGCIIYTL